MANERIAEYMEETPTSWLQSLFEQSATQKHRLGVTRRLSDGREFIYVKVGAANLAVGKCVQGAAVEANHANIACALANVGDREIKVTLGNANMTANQYAEGFIHVNSNTASGYIYKIRSHPAANANAANVTISLFDKIRGANVANTCKVTLTKHYCKDIIVTPAAATQAIVGVPVVALEANTFGWIQRGGPCPVLTAGTLVAGDIAFEAANGAVGPPTANTVPTTQIVGRVLQVNANAEYSLIDLKL